MMFVIELHYADGSVGFHPRTWSSVDHGAKGTLEQASVYPTKKGASTQASNLLSYGRMVPDPVYQVVKAVVREVEISLA